MKIIFNYNFYKRSGKMAVKVDETQCTGCGACAEVCPMEAIKVNYKAKIDENECTECGTCIDECPNNALSLD
jgi:ferredoxin